MAAVEIDVLMADFNNGRKRGRSPPEMDDDCAPISKRIAHLSLDNSNNNASIQHPTQPQPPEQVNDHRAHQHEPIIPHPHIEHLHIRNPHSHPEGISHDQSQLHQQQHQQQHQHQHQHQHQQFVQPQSSPFDQRTQNFQHQVIQQQHHAMVNQSSTSNASQPLARMYPYQPNIGNSAHYSQNELLYHCYLERTQRHGKTLHPSFYERQ